MNLRYLRLSMLAAFLPDDPEGGGGGETAPADKPAEPAATPFNELTADEKVEFLLQKTRRLEDASKGKSADPDARALRARVKELEKHEQTVKALEEASRTEAEKAVLKAKEDGERAGREAERAAAVDTFGPRLVNTEFRAQLAGRMTAEQVATLTGKLNVRAFLTDEGDVDSAAVAEYVAAIPAAPAASAAAPLTPGAFGAGRREPTKTDGLTAGEDMYARRHKKTSA